MSSPPLLNPDDRRKLAAILGMLGSDAAGERAAAGLLATRMLKAAGATWADLLEPPPAAQPRPTYEQQEQPTHAAAIVTCRRLAEYLTDWEVGFVDSVARRRNLTPKQMATLLGIAAALPGRAV